MTTTKNIPTLKQWLSSVRILTPEESAEQMGVSVGDIFDESQPVDFYWYGEDSETPEGHITRDWTTKRFDAYVYSDCVSTYEADEAASWLYFEWYLPECKTTEIKASLATLTQVYEDWLKWQGIPNAGSADEVLSDPMVTGRNAPWSKHRNDFLKWFISVWEEVELTETQKAQESAPKEVKLAYAGSENIIAALGLAGFTVDAHGVALVRSDSLAYWRVNDAEEGVLPDDETTSFYAEAAPWGDQPGEVPDVQYLQGGSFVELCEWLTATNEILSKKGA